MGDFTYEVIRASTRERATRTRSNQAVHCVSSEERHYNAGRTRYFLLRCVAFSFISNGGSDNGFFSGITSLGNIRFIRRRVGPHYIQVRCGILRSS